MAPRSLGRGTREAAAGTLSEHAAPKRILRGENGHFKPSGATNSKGQMSLSPGIQMTRARCGRLGASDSCWGGGRAAGATRGGDPDGDPGWGRGRVPGLMDGGASHRVPGHGAAAAPETRVPPLGPPGHAGHHSPPTAGAWGALGAVVWGRVGAARGADRGGGLGVPLGSCLATPGSASLRETGRLHSPALVSRNTVATLLPHGGLRRVTTPWHLYRCPPK